MYRNFVAGLGILALLIGAGCTKPGAPVLPREILGKYVENAFGMRSPGDIEQLKSFTTGAAAAELTKLQADEELFRRQFVDQKYRPGSLKIRDERKLPDGRYSITYELTYQVTTPKAEVDSAPAVLEGSPGPGSAKQVKESAEDRVTVKKHAVFVQQDGRWLISEVQSLNTLIEHSEEKISADGKSGASAGK